MTVLTRSTVSFNKGPNCSGRGVAAEDVDLAEEGMISIVDTRYQEGYRGSKGETYS
jgi:hypothetical protein